MNELALQVLAEHLRDNLGNRLTVAVANGIFNVVTEAANKPPPEPPQPSEEPQQPA